MTPRAILLAVLFGLGAAPALAHERTCQAPVVVTEEEARAAASQVVATERPDRPAAAASLFAFDQGDFWEIFKGTNFGELFGRPNLIVQFGMGMRVDKSSGAVSNVTSMSRAPRPRRRRASLRAPPAAAIGLRPPNGTFEPGA